MTTTAANNRNLPAELVDALDDFDLTGDRTRIAAVLSDPDVLARRLYEVLRPRLDDDVDDQSRDVWKVGYLIMHAMPTDDDEGCRWCGGVPEIGRTGCQPCLESRGLSWGHG
jgi:hypothetical protein